MGTRVFNSRPLHCVVRNKHWTQWPTKLNLITINLPDSVSFCVFSSTSLPVYIWAFGWCLHLNNLSFLLKMSSTNILKKNQALLNRKFQLGHILYQFYITIQWISPNKTKVLHVEYENLSKICFCQFVSFPDTQR